VGRALAALPFFTAYDPPGTSEGSLDPLGLYAIADELAVRLVPGVRERMQRVRFLTAITVGALVLEDLAPNPRQPRLPPYLVWEWLVVEALVRALGGEEELWGVPGSYVVGRAVEDRGYVDERSYLKTPRIFGFHGVYKRLGVHLGLVDWQLRLRSPRGDELIRAWAHGQGIGSFGADHGLYKKWRKAVETSLRETPARTRTPPGWKQADWQELAEAFAPHLAGRQEKSCLRRLLLGDGAEAPGALVPIWRLLAKTDGEYPDERAFHRELYREAPEYGRLLEAIGAYEGFARNLTDAFDILRAEGSRQDVRGLETSQLASDADFRMLAQRCSQLYREAARRLETFEPKLAGEFAQRFGSFAEPVPPERFGATLCEHHEAVQKAKSREGKRPWFEPAGPGRIYIRLNYRLERREPTPSLYVHQYRTEPVARFYRDLA